MQLDDLVRAVLAGDERAWTALGDDLGEKLEPFFAVAAPECDSHDLAQKTLIVVHRKLPEFDVEASAPFIAWVRAIARNLIKEELRQRWRRERLAQKLAMVEREPSRNLSSALNRAELLAIIEQELAKLDSRFRRVIENDLAGGDDDAFAARENIKPGTVRTRRLRAYEKLRRMVNERLIAGERHSSPSSP